MASIEQYQIDIQKYRNLKEQLFKIISGLEGATGCISSLDFEIQSSYKVDGNSANISNQAIALRGSLEETSDYLKNTILPSIDSSIEYAEESIAYLEELERQRREEEERRRREEEEAWEAEMARQAEASSWDSEPDWQSTSHGGSSGGSTVRRKEYR